jgi:hypothetical protein
VEYDKTVIRIPTPSPPLVPLGESLCETEKAESFAYILEAQFLPVTVPSVPSVIEMVDVALDSYLQIPANEPQVAKPYEVQKGVNCLKVFNASG